MLAREAFAEFIGSALLAATVVGSGIAATRLTEDIALQLLINAVITGAALVALILALGPVSAAFNPVVTLVERALGVIDNRTVGVLAVAQVAGCCAGVVLANLMYDLPAVDLSNRDRSEAHLLLSEVVATFGLVVIIVGVVRAGREASLAYAVGGYITAAYWFAASTSFANPAITLGRMLTDTFAGIEPSSAPGFILAQLLGGALAVLAVLTLYPDPRRVAAALVDASEPGP
ncbi:MAG: aquaporin [Sporichthyaceae bacterium]